MKFDNEKWLETALAKLQKEHLERHLSTFPNAGGKFYLNGKKYLNFSSNDYLNFANHRQIIAATIKYAKQFGASATSSRLVTGNLSCHDELEQELAKFKNYPAALVFGSGWLANLSVISAIVGKNDQIYMDKLCHASIVDAAILSRAKIFRFQHNSTEHLQKLLTENASNEKKLIITESVFSMDGDIAPLTEITKIAKQFAAMMMVDEAHATGIFGLNGQGLVSQLNLTNDINICMGTLSKALGSYGGFIACSNEMREYIINKGRGFVYTTALPPSSVGAAIAALKLLQKQPNLGKQLLERAKKFRQMLQSAGINTGNSQSHIIPIIIGTNATTLAFAQELKNRGIIGMPIRPPTVPKNQARIRIAITLAHSDKDLENAAFHIIHR